MIICEECGYKSTQTGPKRRCIRCGSDFARSEQADRILGETKHDASEYDRGPYGLSMVKQGWTFLPGQHNTPCDYASIQPA